MIGKIEFDVITKRLEERCDAITANVVIDTIKRQIKEIEQLNAQLKTCQRECKRLRDLK